jgi:hypothetical protein
MKSVLSITFPRSGQTIFETIMEKYFGDSNFKYADSHGFQDKFPCPLLNINLHKTHDFKLDVPTTLNYPYIIRIRNPIESIISWYNFNFSTNVWNMSQDDIKWFFKFSNEKIKFWEKFVQKWIINNREQNYYIHKYQDFISDPLEFFSFTIQEIFQEKIDEIKLKDTLDHFKIGKKNTIKDFRHYDQSFLKNLENSVNETIEAVGLPLNFN